MVLGGQGTSGYVHHISGGLLLLCSGGLLALMLPASAHALASL